jgi:hypothetical protein
LRRRRRRLEISLSMQPGGLPGVLQPLAHGERALQGQAPRCAGRGRCTRARARRAADVVLGQEQRERAEAAVQRGHERVVAVDEAGAGLDERLVDVAVDLQAGVEGPRERVGGHDGQAAAHRDHGGDAELADQAAGEPAEAVLAGVDAALAGGEEDEVRQGGVEGPEVAQDVVLLDDVDPAVGGLEEQQGLAALDRLLGRRRRLVAEHALRAAVGDDVEDRVPGAGQRLADRVERRAAGRAGDRAEEVAADAPHAVADGGRGDLGIEGGEVVVGRGRRGRRSRPARAGRWAQLAGLAVDGARDVARVGDALVEPEELEAVALRAAQALPDQRAQLGGVDREHDVERLAAADRPGEAVADRPDEQGPPERLAVVPRAHEAVQLDLVDVEPAREHRGHALRALVQDGLDRPRVADSAA